MSDARTVKVASVEVKVDPNGKWTKYALVDGNGEKASTFDKKVGEFLQANVGKQIDITTEKDGKFTNLLSAVEHVEAPAASSGGGYMQRDPDTEMRIAREACLKAAVALHGPAEGDHFNIAGDEVIRLATRFQHWVYTGETPELTAAIAPKPTNGASKIADISPRPATTFTARNGLLVECSRLFNQHPDQALEFLAGQQWPTSTARLSDEQLVQLRDHLLYLTRVPA